MEIVIEQFPRPAHPVFIGGGHRPKVGEENRAGRLVMLGLIGEVPQIGQQFRHVAGVDLGLPRSVVQLLRLACRGCQDKNSGKRTQHGEAFHLHISLSRFRRHHVPQVVFVAKSRTEPGAWKADPRESGLNAPHQDQHDDDDEHEAEAARRVVAPVAAVTPCRQGADEYEYENNDQNRSEAHHITQALKVDASPPTVWGLAKGRGRFC